ncbi:glycosyltransferase family 9 protein [Microbispora sp. ATCC PTA-5024]|uniref:glycosyltransferase family 9 protein n=1 Tax=Microbispora sp. ATCC PTA-5024 TaxID=316330 RepID=UPI0003DBDFCD|nr:glycosyltransferase family 9 protein [Microbispora sp. ATCC PTA-5024]ETK31739.1 glycosyl transferase [Microbispora sp. ATCC PTA-5024]
MAVTALVLRSHGMEGLLTAVPALRALRRGGLRVVLACPPELSELAALTGAVDRLLPARGLTPLAWPGPGEDEALHPLLPEIAVNLHGRGPQSHRVLLDLGPRRLWAYAHEAVPRVAGPRWDPAEPGVQRWCRLVQWYGVPADPDDLRLPTPMVASPAPGAVVIHPGAGETTLRWPPDRFATVARTLADEGLPVVVTGSGRERPMALLVATRAVLPPQIVLAGRTSLRELCALVAGARLVISADPGMARLAMSYGTPSVTVSAPDGRRHRLLHETPGGGLPADDVIRAAFAALGAGVR